MSLLRLSISLLPLFLLKSAFSAALTPPDPIPFSSYEEPSFPAALAATPVTKGHATVVFTADASGKLEDALILSASHPAFAESVLTAVPKWHLAASSDGTASVAPTRRQMMYYEFQRHGAIVSLTHRDSTQFFFSPSLDGEREIRTVTWRELTAPPARISSINPQYPPALRVERATGTATVNFVIDQTGAVRVPVVIAADRPEFGAAALEAIKHWHFAAPLQGGQPVNVEAERRFTFGKSR